MFKTRLLFSFPSFCFEMFRTLIISFLNLFRISSLGFRILVPLTLFEHRLAIKHVQNIVGFNSESQIADPFTMRSGTAHIS